MQACVVLFLSQSKAITPTSPVECYHSFCCSLPAYPHVCTRTDSLSLPHIHTFSTPETTSKGKTQKEINLQLLINKQPRHPLPRPNTHTRQQNPLLLPPTLTQPRTNLSRPCRSQRMSQRNRSPPHIQFRIIDTERI